MSEGPTGPLAPSHDQIWLSENKLGHPFEACIAQRRSRCTENTDNRERWGSSFVESPCGRSCSDVQQRFVKKRKQKTRFHKSVYQTSERHAPVGFLIQFNLFLRRKVNQLISNAADEQGFNNIATEIRNRLV